MYEPICIQVQEIKQNVYKMENTKNELITEHANIAH